MCRSQPLARSLMKELQAHALLDQRIAVSIDQGIANDNSPNLRSEAHDAGMTLEVGQDLHLIRNLIDMHIGIPRIKIVNGKRRASNMVESYPARAR